MHSIYRCSESRAGQLSRDVFTAQQHRFVTDCVTVAEYVHSHVVHHVHGDRVHLVHLADDALDGFGMELLELSHHRFHLGGRQGHRVAQLDGQGRFQESLAQFGLLTGIEDLQQFLDVHAYTVLAWSLLDIS